MDQEQTDLQQFSYELLYTILPHYIHKMFEKVENDFHEYFENTCEAEKWKAETKSKLIQLQTQIQENARNRCHELISTQTLKAGTYSMNCITVIQKNIEGLINGETVDMKKVKELVDTEWKGKMQVLHNTLACGETTGVELTVEESLINFFKHDQDKVFAKLRQNGLKEWGVHLELEEEPLQSHIKFDQGLARQMIDKFSQHKHLP